MLCVLQLWKRKVSANSTRQEMLLTEKRKPEPLKLCRSNSGFGDKSKVGAFNNLCAKLKGLYF